MNVFGSCLGLQLLLKFLSPVNEVETIPKKIFLVILKSSFNNKWKTKTASWFVIYYILILNIFFKKKKIFLEFYINSHAQRCYLWLLSFVVIKYKTQDGGEIM